jgi:hypothetical protein
MEGEGGDRGTCPKALPPPHIRESRDASPIRYTLSALAAMSLKIHIPIKYFQIFSHSYDG